MILGFFFIRPIPLPKEEDPIAKRSETSSSAYEQHNDSRSRLLDHDFLEGNRQITCPDDDPHTPIEDDVELSPSSRSQSPSNRRSLSRGAAMALDVLPNLHGRKLWRSSDFLLLFSILSIRAFILSSTFAHI